MLLISVGSGTHGFTLDPAFGEFVLTHPGISVPTRGQIYSVNDARYFDWPKGLQQYIDDIRQGKGQNPNKYSARYICFLVADLQRTLLYGGIAVNPRSHLRLVHEGNPLSFLTEQAGGRGSDGRQRILAIQPTHLHQRLPLFLGRSDDVAEVEGYDGQTGRSQLRAPEFLMPSTRRQTVFDDLPEELKRFILNAVQKCPSHAATARAVCKTWDMIVRSQAPAEEAEPWLVLLLPRRTGSFIEEDFDEAGTCGGATVVEALKEAGRCPYTWLVDASTDKWYQVSLPLKLPATLCRMVGAGASRSGLLAISENWWAPNPSYWVGNPLTNKWRHILPSASSCRRYPQAGWATCVTSELIEERERGTYKIVQLRVCSRHTEDPTTGHAQLQAWPRIVVMTASTYDSATKSWNSGRGIGQHWGTFVCTCGSEGIIYILLMHPVENMELGRVMVTLMAYHVEAEKFSTAVPAKELAYRGEGIPVWRTMKLVANKLEIAIWIGIALHYSWPAQPSLDSLGIFRLDTASQRWVLDEPCRVNVATPGAGDCMNYNITPGSGSVSHLATMHTSCPILGELIRTQDAPLRSPTVLSLAKVPSQVKRDLLASASGGSATTIVPRFGAEP